MEMKKIDWWWEAVKSRIPDKNKTGIYSGVMDSRWSGTLFYFITFIFRAFVACPLMLME
jgi:hypothetical protein